MYVFVASVIELAKRTRLFVSFVACQTEQYVSILSHKIRFSEKGIEYKMCFDFLYNFFLKHFSL